MCDYYRGILQFILIIHTKKKEVGEGKQFKCSATQFYIHYAVSTKWVKNRIFFYSRWFEAYELSCWPETRMKLFIVLHWARTFKCFKILNTFPAFHSTFYNPG